MRSFVAGPSGILATKPQALSLQEEANSPNMLTHGARRNADSLIETKFLHKKTDRISACTHWTCISHVLTKGQS